MMCSFFPNIRLQDLITADVWPSNVKNPIQDRLFFLIEKKRNRKGFVTYSGIKKMRSRVLYLNGYGSVYDDTFSSIINIEFLLFICHLDYQQLFAFE